jgi:sulfur-carrier protein
MRVTVRSYATMRKYTAHLPEGGELQVPDGSTVEDVLHLLKVPPDAGKILLVNGRPSSEDRVLQPEDLFVFFPPLEGG